MEDRKNIGHATCVILVNEDGKILSVSRKDDHSKLGLPGGKVDESDGTDYKGAAIREVKEETGLNISYDDFTKAMKINKRAIFYYLEMDACDIEVQDSIVNNDANGITWIKIQCLEQSIINGNIVLNHYAKLVFSHFLNKVFPKSSWIKVCRRRKKKKDNV